MAVKPPSPLHRRIEFCVEAHTAGSFYAEVARRSLASVGGISLLGGVVGDAIPAKDNPNFHGQAGRLFWPPVQKPRRSAALRRLLSA